MGDARGPSRKLGQQPSCSMFASSKLLILRRCAHDIEGAEQAFEVAITKGATWDNPWQLPPEHLVGLLAQPVWPSKSVQMALTLASAFDDIVKDFQRLEVAVQKGRLQWQATPDFFLLASGT